MNKPRLFLKASYFQLRMYIYGVAAAVAASVIANFIVSLALGEEQNSGVSIANLCLIILIFVACVLPLGFFKRMINLGASRKQYYIGILTVYSIWAAALALFNVLWLQIEISFAGSFENNFNILEIFGWSQFGIAGSFVYQFGAYMVLMSLLNLLFSGLRHAAGWIIWFLLIAAIPIGTSVPAYRPLVAEGFLTLLFNDSLIQGFGLTLLFSLVFFAGGWLFTRKRPV